MRASVVLSLVLFSYRLPSRVETSHGLVCVECDINSALSQLTDCGDVAVMCIPVAFVFDLLQHLYAV